MINDDKIKLWVGHALDSQVAQGLHRIASAPGVQQIAVLPDVHLSKKLCNGVAVATGGTIFPEAVGGDIGCGYLWAEVIGGDRTLKNKRSAGKLLKHIERAVPIIRHPRESIVDLPDHLLQADVCCDALDKLKTRDAKVQWGTLGRGNHFIEFQVSMGGKLHVLIHSGSRAVGPAVLAEHMRHAEYDESSKLRFFQAESRRGAAYLNDMQWARDYAAANRLRMLMRLDNLLTKFGMSIELDSLVNRDHNHVRLEQHDGETLWVHRKGAQRLTAGETAVVPGSMGTPSFLVSGRELAGALRSCSHGAGRRMSRTKAAQTISAKDLKQQMNNVCFDAAKAHRLCDEAPKAYKDIRKVMRAQNELVRIEEERLPLLNFKAG